MGSSRDDAQRVLADARDALADGNRTTMLGAFLELRELQADGLPGGLAEEADQLAREILRHVRDRKPTSAAARQAQHERVLTPCSACGGQDLLVGSPVVEIAVTRQVTLPIAMMLIVCRECGDGRLRADDPARLERLADARGNRVFSAVTVRGTRRGPFR